MSTATAKQQRPPLGNVVPSSQANYRGSSANDLSAKSRDELLDQVKKVIGELSTKDRLIYDLKANQNWLIAEVQALKVNKSGSGPSLDDLLIKKGILSKEEVDSARTKVLQTLLHFRKEIAKAKTVIEHNSKIIVESERKRGLAEQEIFHLRTSIDDYQKDGGSNALRLEQERSAELNRRLETNQAETSSLQSKLASWARYSKQHQDGLPFNLLIKTRTQISNNNSF